MLSRILNVLVFSLVFLGNGIQSVLAQEYVVREIEYKTEDGWTISGTMRIPLEASETSKHPAAVLLHANEHDRNDFSNYNDTGLAQDLAKVGGIISLAIDWRGREKSAGKHQPVPETLHDLSTQVQELMYLDVKGAMEFLAATPEVDRGRIAVVATQFSAEHAVKAVRKTLVPTRALVLLGGHGLSKESKDYLATVEFPLYTGASILDRQVYMDMAEVYTRAQSPNSVMIAPVDAERGYNLLGLQQDTLEKYCCGIEGKQNDLLNWLLEQVKNLGTTQAVSLQTADGWTIYGNYRQPDDMGRDGKLRPGIIMVPGARSNRYSMYRFEEELARRGYAVLAIEMRGRGASMQGKTIDAPEVREVRDNLLGSPFELDTKAAIEFIASQKGVDPNRIGIVGEARGTRSSLLAAAGDNRIKAMALMSVYQPDEKMEQVISQMDIPILLLDGETNWAAGGTSHVHKLAKRSQIMIYPGMGHSHHIRYFHPQIVGFIADFMEREMPATVR